jgi:zinc/manganese transport system substrate-binding protein
MRRALSRVLRYACRGALCAGLAWPAAAAPLKILAAESVYGEVAGAIAGGRAAVTSVLSSPRQDPHDFEARPSTARAVAGADIVVLNGAGYDPWMQNLVAASAAPGSPVGRDVIVVSDLVHAPAGANPHLWYDPATMPVLARALALALTRHDPAGAAAYQQNLQGFLAGTAMLQARIGALRQAFNGAPVAATEPVFDDMARVLGLHMQGVRFQLATMNGTEPRASDVAAIESDLKQHRVRALISNRQVTSAATQRLLGLAQQAGIPVVAITETLPPGQTYTGWMLAELDALNHALTGP